MDESAEGKLSQFLDCVAITAQAFFVLNEMFNDEPRLWLVNKAKRIGIIVRNRQQFDRDFSHVLFETHLILDSAKG